MSPECYFRRNQNYTYIRLALEDWTELPQQATQEWETLTQLLKAACEFQDGALCETAQNGYDLYLLLKLDLSTPIETVVASLRRQVQDPSNISHWRPFIDFERFAWVGEYHAVSIRPGDTLRSQALEHPARRGKRQDLERRLGRSLEFPWHEAPSPEAVGVEFVSGIWYGAAPERSRLDLLYEPATVGDEARAAVHLNTRLRISGTRPLLESVGWSKERGLPGLVFSVPTKLHVEIPTSVEVWWATGERRQVGILPCYQIGAEPPFSTEGCAGSGERIKPE